MSSSSLRISARSESESDRPGRSRKKRSILTVDQLFPSETNRSGTKGKRLDINSLFSGTATNPDVVIDLSHETLIERRKQRKDDLHRQYLLEYKRCWDKINASDNDRLNETIFEVQGEIERFPEYSPIDCVELIQDKLRTEEFMDTVILADNKSVYISWANIERNRDAYLKELENEDKSDRSEDGRDDRDDKDDTSTDRAKTDTDDLRQAFDSKIKSMIGPSETETDNDRY